MSNKKFILEGNKTLSKFMDYEDFIIENNKLYFGVHDDLEEDEINYHDNWNLLMQVVEKIIKLDFHIEITPTDCVIKENPWQHEISWTSYSSEKMKFGIFETCFEFVDWYNEKEEN